MQTGFFIRGGWTPLHKHERNLAGLPSRRFCGPFYFRFPITDRHTAYEWSMVLADVHPYAHPLADQFASQGDLTAGTIAGRQARERAVEGWSEQAKAIYYTLRAEFEAGRLEPLRREWCADRPGIDPPDVLDFTRCVFGIEQVLSLIRRRGDTGRLISELLAMDAAGATDQAEAVAAVCDTAEAADAPLNVERLADWVFARRSLRESFRTLFSNALEAQVGEFTKVAFRTAYQKVYATKAHKPPATGWPLRSPYKDRA